MMKSEPTDLLTIIIIPIVQNIFLTSENSLNIGNIKQIIGSSGVDTGGLGANPPWPACHTPPGMRAFPIPGLPYRPPCGLQWTSRLSVLN